MPEAGRRQPGRPVGVPPVGSTGTSAGSTPDVGALKRGRKQATNPVPDTSSAALSGGHNPTVEPLAASSPGSDPASGSSARGSDPASRSSARGSDPASRSSEAESTMVVA